MKHCPRKNTPTGIGVNPLSGIAIVHKMGCKSWACPYCSMKRKGFLVVKAYMGIESYKQAGVTDWFFGTLTMHRKWRKEASVTNFRRNWNKFYQRMKRATNGNLYYILLPEKHKDGSLHVHIISTCQKETKWWKDNGAKCGMGFKNENEPLVSTVKAAYYVTKYVGKSLGVSAWPTDLRRVRFSVRWPKPIPDETLAWNCFPPDVAKHFVFKRLAMGYKIINPFTGEIANVKKHTTNASTRRIPDLGLSEKNQFILEGTGIPETRMGKDENERLIQLQAGWLQNTSHQH